MPARTDGPSGNGPIPPNADLRFEVWLQHIERGVQRDSAKNHEYDKVAKAMLGHSADDLEVMKDEGIGTYARVLQDILHKTYVMKCRAEVKTVEGVGERLNFTILEATPMDYTAEALKLVDAIELLAKAPIDLTSVLSLYTSQHGTWACR